MLKNGNFSYFAIFVAVSGSFYINNCKQSND
jgi:hypothetical protein